MMNKVFVLLLALTVAGAGVLFWLLKTMPQNAVPDPHAEHGENTVVSKPEGVEIKEGETKEGAPTEAAKDKKEGHDTPVLKINTEPVKAVVFVDGEMKGQTPLELTLTDKTQQVKLEAPGFNDVTREAPAIKPDMDLDTLTWTFILHPQSGTAEAKAEAHAEKASAHASDKAVARATEKSGKLIKKEAAKSKAAPHGVFEKTPAPKETAAEVKEAPVEVVPVKTVAADADSAKSAEVPNPVESPKAKSKTAKVAKAPTTEFEAAKENPEGILFLSGKSGPVWIQIQSVPGTQKKGAEENILSYRKALNLNVMGCTVSVKGKGEWVRILTGPFDNKTEASNMLKGINSRLRDPAFITGVQECL